MNNYLSAIGLAALWLAVLLPAQEKTAEMKDKPAQTEQGGPLVRKDLLADQEKPTVSLERNIFRPDRRRAPGATQPDPGAPFQPGVTPEDGATGEKPEEDSVITSGYVPPLRYIGYVGSGTRAVALIMIHGEAQAVCAGDSPIEGIKIKSVTPMEIEFAGPDDTTRRVSIEGEER